MTHPTGRRSVVAVVLVILGLLLTPFAVVSQAVRTTVTDTDAFVATFGPLAESRAIQDAVAAAVTDAIAERADLGSVADSLIQDLIDSGASRPTVASLRLLKPVVLAGLRQSVSLAVERVVTAREFADVWRAALRASHPRLLATLDGDPQATISLTGDTVALELGPILQRARQRLIEEGLTFARFIPADAQATVPLAEVAGLGGIRVAYRAVVALGVWLPVAAVALLATGTAVAVARLRWLVRIGVLVFLAMALLGLLVATGRSALRDTGAMGPGVLDDLYGILARQLVPAIVWVGLAGALLASAAWLAPRVIAARAPGPAG